MCVSLEAFPFRERTGSLTREDVSLYYEAVVCLGLGASKAPLSVALGMRSRTCASGASLTRAHRIALRAHIARAMRCHAMSCDVMRVTRRYRCLHYVYDMPRSNIITYTQHTQTSFALPPAETAFRVLRATGVAQTM